MLTELRQDKRHYDTRAEYYLWIKKDSAKALHWAKINWEVSKTPAAASLLTMASKISGDIQSINEVRAWLRTSKVEDDNLESLLDTIQNMEMVI